MEEGEWSVVECSVVEWSVVEWSVVEVVWEHQWIEIYT